MRYRTSIQDVLFLFAFLAVAAFVAFEFDIFENAPGVPSKDYIIELDEALLLGAIVCVGLLGIAGRFLLLQNREVARRIAAERHARELAMQDALTGLPNRRQFDSELKAAVGAPPRAGGAHAVFMLDLNDFKAVNDVFGHAVGDEVLIHVAGRLKEAVRDGDLVARLGGDEFAVLALHLPGAEEAASIALRVIRELDRSIATGQTDHQIGVGIGIALIPQDGAADRDILRKADIALYRAKAERVSALRFFEQEMDTRVRERDFVERELRAAIKSHAIVPYYQPLVDLKSGAVIGFEALARWVHPVLGQVEPERFIAVAEDCGLIRQLSDQLLRRACRDAREWPNSVTLSFNISPVQLKDPAFGLRILSILAEAGLAPGRLEIELTESAVVRDLEAARDVLGSLRSAGVRIALDDFGTGYSSLYHLRNFEIDKIKIDRSFVESMQRDPKMAALVRALLGLGSGLGLTLTAEGVEQSGQAAALMQDGCQQAQGFLYSAAVPASETRAFFAGQAAREPTQNVA